MISAIEFRDAALMLAGRIVLADLTLDIAAGEFVGVFGPNGAGKTTLLRAVLGLVPPARGAIRVLGRRARRGRAAIGYMPQARSGVPAHLSGRDFVGAVVKGQRLGLPLSGRGTRAEVDRVLDLVSGGDLARRPLAELSGGERQRLLLAQALIGQPRLLLLDEPLISLDPRREAEIVALVKRLQSELGITVLFTAHEINPLLAALDRVLYLGRGRAAVGTVDEVITGPVLSRLYGTDIDVMRAQGHVFVMAKGHSVERAAHRHDDDGAEADPRQRHRHA